MRACRRSARARASPGRASACEIAAAKASGAGVARDEPAGGLVDQFADAADVAGDDRQPRGAGFEQHVRQTLPKRRVEKQRGLVQRQIGEIVEWAADPEIVRPLGRLAAERREIDARQQPRRRDGDVERLLRAEPAGPEHPMAPPLAQSQMGRRLRRGPRSRSSTGSGSAKNLARSAASKAWSAANSWIVRLLSLTSASSWSMARPSRVQA